MLWWVGSGLTKCCGLGISGSMRSLLIMLRAIPQSLYSETLYREVFRQWRGAGLLYLSLLLFLSLVPIAIQRNSQLNEVLSTHGLNRDTAEQDLLAALDNIYSQLPPITIRNGEVSTTVEEPYIITHPGTHDPMLVIDTTGQTRVIPESAILMITKRTFYYRGLSGKIGALDAKWVEAQFGQTLSDGPITSLKEMKRIKEMGIMALHTGPYLLTLGDFIRGWLIFTVRAIFFAAFAYIVVKSLIPEMTFPAILRLTIVAGTPVVVLEALAALLDQPLLQYPNFVYFLLQGTYLVFGVAVNYRNFPKQ